MGSVDEAAFEAQIAAWLLDHGGYRRVKVGGAGGDFDGNAGVDTADLFEFIGATQGDRWDKLVDSGYGGDEVIARAKFVQRLASQLDKRGTVDVLRRGVTDYNVRFRLAYFKPGHGLAPELVERYEANILTVVRQFRYEPTSNKTIDLGLFVNGIPVATAELKNPLTGQSVEHAMLQYRNPPGPEEPDTQARGSGALCRGSVPSIDDHPSGRQADPVPAVQPGDTISELATPLTQIGAGLRTFGSGCGHRMRGRTSWAASSMSRSRPRAPRPVLR